MDLNLASHVSRSHVSTNLTTTTTSFRPTDSSFSLTSLSSDDCSRSINNESIYNESCNESIYHASMYNESGYNESIYDDLAYTPSITGNSLSVSEFYSPSINTQNNTLSSHALPSEVTPTLPVRSGRTSTADIPQNSQRPSAPGTISPGHPITNAQHNINANEDQYGPLPEGWESGVDPLGLTYYVNHHTRSIVRNHPSSNQILDHHAQDGETNTAQDQHSRRILVDDILEAASSGSNTQPSKIAGTQPANAAVTVVGCGDGVIAAKEDLKDRILSIVRNGADGRHYQDLIKETCAWLKEQLEEVSDLIPELDRR